MPTALQGCCKNQVTCAGQWLIWSRRVINTPFYSPWTHGQPDSYADLQVWGQEPYLALSLLVLERGIQQHYARILDVAPHPWVGHVLVDHDPT